MNVIKIATLNNGDKIRVLNNLELADFIHRIVKEGWDRKEIYEWMMRENNNTWQEDLREVTK